jgi:tetratricopeptide (TPR) repeat protein
MAVLVEAISVIARRDRLDELFPGGGDQYINDCPNATACADAHLVRIGFMDPDAARAHVRRMESLGFVHLDDQGAARDIVVIDQLHGPTSPCDWVESGQVTIDGTSIAVARLVGDESMQLITPPGWKYEQSLTNSHRFVPTPDVPDAMKFLHEKDGLFVYFDPHTRQRFFTPTPPSPAQIADLAGVLELIREDDIAAAYARVQQSLHVQPASPLGWSMAGECLRSLGRDDDAIEAFQKSLDLGRVDAGTFAALADCHRGKGDLQAAESLFDRAASVASAEYLHVMLHSLGTVLLEAGRHLAAADCFERSLQAFARSTVARLAQENHRDAALVPEPAINAEVWCECASYAAMYSTAADATLKAFAIPTPESRLAEAESRAHGGLYWEDKTDPDGCRTRHFLPNYFNAFWSACLSDPLYRVIVWSRGAALKAVGSPDADKHLVEAQLIHSIAPQSDEGPTVR